MNVLDEFKEITGYDLRSWFTNYVNFISYKSQNIMFYYSGGELKSSSFLELDNLIDESYKITPLFESYSEYFKYIDYWELLDKFSDAQSSLFTLKNMSKWMRSSRLNSYSQGVSIQRGLRQGETLETLTSSLGYVDFQEDWKGISVDNLLNEEDYTSAGANKIISVSLQNDANSNVQNIVDNLYGKSVLGKDMLKKISFEDNDIKTVEFSNSLSQTLETILSTTKGSIPEFPNDGISDELIGTNANAIQYPTLFRNILALFQKDGRWREVNLLDLKRVDDIIVMDLECKSILNDSYKSNIVV